ncbi:MAG: sigma-70 family RNA polymerase sigma factor [Acidobacteriia bacterium]|nr:sigma-70 family RNA polymerase sigma factor [Terriglobia bacterium]
MPAHLENEAAVVRRAQMGDSESFSILVKQYERRIYRLSYAVTKNAEDAEDVLQETFLKAYSSIGRFKVESRFYTWLVRIAMNESITKLRRKRAPSWVSLDQPARSDEPISASRDVEDWRDNPEESYSGTELRAILSKALLDLETRLRIVVVLRDIEGLSTEDTARVLGLSVAAVKSRLMRGRLQLRKRLSSWFERRPILAAK